MAQLRYQPAVLVGAAAGLEVMAQHRAQGWISDDRHLGAVRPRALDRAFATALPRLGVRRTALLESQEVLSRRTIDAAYQQNEPAFAFTLRRFANPAGARSWALNPAGPAW